MQTVTTIGLDIAKSVFRVHGIDAQGNVIVRRQLKRRYVLVFFQKRHNSRLVIVTFRRSRKGTHRTHHAYRLYNSAGLGDRRLTWSQMPPCHNLYITGVPCITSYDRGCWKRNDDDPVEHCGNGQWPIPLGQQ